MGQAKPDADKEHSRPERTLQSHGLSAAGAFLSLAQQRFVWAPGNPCEGGEEGAERWDLHRGALAGMSYGNP